MKTIIAGSRVINDYLIVREAIKESGFKITEVVSGGARGVDSLGERWAKENNTPVKRFPANWDKHGRGAGPIRNDEMANYAEALIAIWDGKSKGTEDMIKRARGKCLKGYVYELKWYYDHEATLKANQPSEE